MLIACGLAGLSALEAHYAGPTALTQTERDYVARSGLIRFRPSIASRDMVAMKAFPHLRF